MGGHCAPAGGVHIGSLGVWGRRSWDSASTSDDTEACPQNEPGAPAQSSHTRSADEQLPTGLFSLSSCPARPPTAALCPELRWAPPPSCTARTCLHRELELHRQRVTLHPQPSPPAHKHGEGPWALSWPLLTRPTLPRQAHPRPCIPPLPRVPSRPRPWVLLFPAQGHATQVNTKRSPLWTRSLMRRDSAHWQEVLKGAPEAARSTQALHTQQRETTFPRGNWCRDTAITTTSTSSRGLLLDALTHMVVSLHLQAPLPWEKQAVGLKTGPLEQPAGAAQAGHPSQGREGGHCTSLVRGWKHRKRFGKGRWLWACGSRPCWRMRVSGV